MMGYAADVTVIVPTLNRARFVSKMLQVFEELGFQGHVLIGDSSVPEQVQQTAQAVSQIRNFRVIHRTFPGKKVFECIAELIPFIETPYTVWMCDDDMLIPRTLESCARFLEQHPDYSAVGGVAIALELDPDQLTQALAASRYRVDAIEDDWASDRLRRLLADYTVTGYALSRTEQFVKRFHPSVHEGLTDVTFGTELLPSWMHVVQGKVAMLGQLFVVRLKHGRHYLFPDAFDWITNSGWGRSYEIVRDCLAQEIAARDRCSLDEAQTVVKQAIWGYVGKVLVRQWRGRGWATHEPRTVKTQLKTVPGLSTARAGVQGVRQYLQRSRDRRLGYSLSTLMNGSSPYAQDFQSVYRLITQRELDESTDASKRQPEFLTTGREWNDTVTS